MTTDESLMLHFQAGSREAFEELFLRYRQPVYAFFRRRVSGPSTAEDLAQETWVAVLKGTDRYEPRALFRSYLYAIAFRLMLSERRRSARHNALTLNSPAETEADHDAAQWIREAISKLAETEREMILLREYEHLSYEEIADLLRIPVNTVRSRLFRARSAMKQLLEPSAAPAAARRRS